LSSFATDRRAATSGTVVVYVHGLWLGGQESVLLRRRLATTLGATTQCFTYPSVGVDLRRNAVGLERYLHSIRADTLHLVAHSLGGLVVLALFDRLTESSGGAAALPPGRIVLLGSPVGGSQTARRLLRLPFGRALLGRTGGELLLEPVGRRWGGARDLGVIAGDQALGAGRLLGSMGAANDGTVLVSETDLPGATEQVRLRVSHSGMVFSSVVAQQVAAFLKHGRFGR